MRENRFLTKAASIVGGMDIILKHWTVGNLCWALNEIDSAGQEGLESPEFSAVRHDGSLPSIVDYVQQLGLCRRGLIEHPDCHAQELVPCKSLVALSVPSLCFLLKWSFKIKFIEL